MTYVHTWYTCVHVSVGCTPRRRISCSQNMHPASTVTATWFSMQSNFALAVFMTSDFLESCLVRLCLPQEKLNIFLVHFSRIVFPSFTSTSTIRLEQVSVRGVWQGEAVSPAMCVQ